MLNLEPANALFEKEAVLFGCGNSVPFYRVIELFGKDAAKHAIMKERYSSETSKTIYYNSYWVDGDYVDYLTYNGFLIAATYANIQEIKNRQAEKAATDGKAG